MALYSQMLINENKIQCKTQSLDSVIVMLRVRWPRVAPRAVLELSTHFCYDKTNAHTVMCFGQGQIVNEWPTPRLETSDNLPWPWGVGVGGTPRFMHGPYNSQIVSSYNSQKVEVSTK